MWLSRLIWEAPGCALLRLHIDMVYQQQDRDITVCSFSRTAVRLWQVSLRLWKLEWQHHRCLASEMIVMGLQGLAVVPVVSWIKDT